MGSITHTFQSAIADDPVAEAAGEVTPGRWNAAHTFSLAVADITGLQTELDAKQDALATTTWDIGQKHPFIRVSADRLTAKTRVFDANYLGISTTTSKTSGKWCIAVNLHDGQGDAAGFLAWGLAAPWDNVVSADPTTVADGVYVYDDPGVGTHLFDVGLDEDTILAVDIDAGKVWLWNEASGWEGSPAAGTSPRFTFTAGQEMYFWVAFLNDGTPPPEHRAVLTSMPVALPSGFSHWA